MKELSLCVTMKLDLLLYFLHWVIVWLRRFKLYLIDILLRGRCSLPWPAGGSSGDMLPGDCGWLPLEERFKSETVYKRIYHHQVDLIFSYTRTNVRVNHLILGISALLISPISRLADNCQILAVRSDICKIGQLSDRTTVSADNCQIRQLSDRTTVRSDNCQIGQLSVGQLSVGHGQLSEKTVSALKKL